MIFNPRGLAIALSLAVLTTLGCDNPADPLVESPAELPVESPVGVLPPETQEQPARPSSELQWQERMFAVFGDLRSLHARIDECFPNMAELKTTEQYLAASAEARSMVEQLQTQLTEIAGKLDSLKQESNAPEAADSDEFLATAEKRLDGAQGRINNLKSLADSLSGAAEAIDGSKRQDKALQLVTLASDLEGKGQIDDAIKQYEAALAIWPDATGIRERLDELKRTWTVKSEAHAGARQFAQNVWPNAAASELATLLPKARAALATLKQIDDYLTIRALLLATNEHLQRLSPVADRPPLESGHVPDDLTVDIARFVLEIGDVLDARRQPAGG